MVEEQGTQMVVRLRWSHPQGKAMKSLARFLDLEGSVRSGKTTVAIWKLINYAQNYPGIQMFAARWTQDATDSQLKPRFWELCPKELLDPEKPWNAKEEFVLFANKSKLYIRGLKSSDDAARFSKIAGKTLAVIYIDQPEECPLDIYHYCKTRLSQKGYPQQMFITPNPPGFDHWLCEEFPEDNKKEDHEYVHISIYDNAQNLDPKTIRSYELEYPPGHPLRRSMLEGRRGLSPRGEVIYGKIFRPDLHVKETVIIDGMPVLEAWDFSHAHPAVVWGQFTPWGALHFHAELQGDSEYLEDFIPKVIAMRAQLFGSEREIWTCCDPSGDDTTSHGTKRTAVQVLGEHGIYARYVAGSNRPDKRAFAIQQVAKFMLRLTKEGPALLLSPRCKTLIDGFTAGYVYSEHASYSERYGNIRKPLKDGYYDHLQNCVEYLILNYYSPGALDRAAARPANRASEAAGLFRPNGPRDFEPGETPTRMRRGRAGY
jgi:hypothetical protein